MICIQCNEARFVSGTQMCRNDGRIFCEKLQKLVDKYQECELEHSSDKRRVTFSFYFSPFTFHVYPFIQLLPQSPIKANSIGRLLDSKYNGHQKEEL